MRAFFLSSHVLVRIFVGLLAASMLWLAPAGADAQAPSDHTLIQRENAKPGATDWQLTRIRLDSSSGFRSPWIEGYCSKQSVKAGESIEIMVSTDPPERFQIEIFRMGYYGGRGARLMTKLGPFAGKAQPVPKPGPKAVHECRWEKTTELVIPRRLGQRRLPRSVDAASARRDHRSPGRAT